MSVLGMDIHHVTAWCQWWSGEGTIFPFPGTESQMAVSCYMGAIRTEPGSSAEAVSVSTTKPFL